VDAENAARMLNEPFLVQVDKHGSMASGSRLLGEDDGFLSCQKNHPRGLRAQDAVSSLTVMGVPMAEELFHQAYFSEPKDPSGILRYSRENQKLKPDPLLVELTPLLKELAAAGPTPEGEWESLSHEIRDLDLLRRRDRQKAYQGLGKVLLRALGKLRGEHRPSQAFSDLTGTLGILAAIYRLSGRRDDAVDVLVLAWKLARRVNDAKIAADWHQKAAYLLVDLGRSVRAEEFITRAHLVYDYCGCENERLRTLVDHAYILTQRKAYAEALVLLGPAIERLPPSDIEGRIAAHQCMAVSHQALDQLHEACAHLDQAIVLIGDDELARAYCLARRADLLASCGDRDKAIETYRECLPLFARLTSAVELAELAMECAVLLLVEGRRPELKELAADLSGWLTKLRSNLKLRAAIENFQALVGLDELHVEELKEIRGQISALKERYRQKSLAGRI
jgi:tetratricopeptide (TPR) repeat protein